jgi:hypothetical protein
VAPGFPEAASYSTASRVNAPMFDTVPDSRGPFRCWGRSVIGSAVRLAPASDGIVDTILETEHRADYPALRTEPEVRDERLLATSTSAGASPSFD